MIHLAVNAIAIAVTTSSLTPKGLQQATYCMLAGDSALQRMQAAVSSAAPGTIITAERATAATGGSQTARRALSRMCDPNLLPDLSRNALGSGRLGFHCIGRPRCWHGTTDESTAASDQQKWPTAVVSVCKYVT